MFLLVIVVVISMMIWFIIYIYIYFDDDMIHHYHHHSPPPFVPLLAPLFLCNSAKLVNVSTVSPTTILFFFSPSESSTSTSTQGTWQKIKIKSLFLFCNHINFLLSITFFLLLSSSFSVICIWLFFLAYTFRHPVSRHLLIIIFEKYYLSDGSKLKSTCYC